MKKVFGLLIIVMLLFSVTSIAENQVSYLDKLNDWSGKTIVNVVLPVELPIKTSHDFISRYSYAIGKLNNDEPITIFTDYSSPEDVGISQMLGYTYSLFLGGCSMFYDENMYLLGFEITLYESKDTSDELNQHLNNASLAIQCLELGSSNFVVVLAKQHGLTPSDCISTLFKFLCSDAMNGTYANKVYQTNNFCYQVDCLDIPAHDDVAAFDMYNILVTRIEKQ